MAHLLQYFFKHRAKYAHELLFVIRIIEGPHKR